MDIATYLGLDASIVELFHTAEAILTLNCNKATLANPLVFRFAISSKLFGSQLEPDDMDMEMDEEEGVRPCEVEEDDVREEEEE